jgi:hypothetical protein
MSVGTVSYLTVHPSKTQTNFPPLYLINAIF